MTTQPKPPHPPANAGTSQIINDLANKIEVAVRAGNFTQAEQLREKMIEADPMALSAAIRAGELIASEMAAGIDPDHLELWQDLYERLSDEEQTCLYYSLETITIPKKRILLKYGSRNNRLFLIESGEVAVVMPKVDNKYTLLAKVGRGELLGEYTFATISLCSASAITNTDVQLRYLDTQKAESWEDNHPGLYSKLIDFCLQHGRIEKINKEVEAMEKGETHEICGKVSATLIDQEGKPTSITFRGDVSHLSTTGASFAIHCNQRPTVKRLLTRDLSLEFACNHQGKTLRISNIGKVVRVVFLLYNDYNLHVSFSKPLPKEISDQFKTSS